MCKLGAKATGSLKGIVKVERDHHHHMRGPDRKTPRPHFGVGKGGKCFDVYAL